MTYPYAPVGLTGAPFFTTGELASRLRLDPTTIDTGTATLLSQLASDAVRADLRQEIDYVPNDTITLYGDNGEVILLPQRPVWNVSAVTLAGQSLVPVQVNSTSTMLMYQWRPDGSLRRCVYGGSFYAAELFYKWPLGVPVTVTYDHGYQQVPAAIKHVALELAAGVFSNPELHNSEKVGLVEWTALRDMTLNLSTEQRKSLDVYRNITLTM